MKNHLFFHFCFSVSLWLGLRRCFFSVHGENDFLTKARRRGMYNRDFHEKPS